MNVKLPSFLSSARSCHSQLHLNLMMIAIESTPKRAEPVYRLCRLPFSACQTDYQSPGDGGWNQHLEQANPASILSLDLFYA